MQPRRSPKINFREIFWVVRFSTFATISAISGHGSFDDLVSKRKQLCRRLKVERLCGLKINDQLELGWRLHREVGGLGSFEDPINVYGRLAPLLCVVTAIPDKTA